MPRLSVENYRMPGAPIGKLCPLPDLQGAGDAHQHIKVDEQTITKEEAKYMGYAPVKGVHPYKTQEGYTRQRKPRDYKAVVLENERLKAVFLVGLGGRLWSLIDKDTDTELLHRNPVFQPCNLALRNAWFSGGVEWNAGIIGHTPFTCDDMACEILRLDDGTPVLRMFQYERIRGLFYRVEAFLPKDARELYVRVRIDNAFQTPTAVYWWSNMAVDEREDTRVIVPAKKAYCHGYGGKVMKADIPLIEKRAEDLGRYGRRLAKDNGGKLLWDTSRPTSLTQSVDFFFDVQQGTRPFIAAVNKDGYGMAQTSTRELMGRKLFVWGMAPGGRNWQTFLSQKGESYIELQAGLAKTQLEHLPFEGGQSVSWLESYGAVKLSPGEAAGDYREAVSAVRRELNLRSTAEYMDALHEKVKKLDQKTGKVVHRADGMAKLDALLYGKEFSTAGLSLAAMRLTTEEKPWLALLKHGALPETPPLKEPPAYQLSKRWLEPLLASVQNKKGDHWLSRYMLATIHHAHQDVDEAEKYYLQSIQKAPNPWAYRGLALLEKRKGNAQAAFSHYQSALKLLRNRYIVKETLALLLEMGEYEQLLNLYRELPAALRRIPKHKTYYIEALIYTGELKKARRCLSDRRFVLTDMREGQVTLSDLWFKLVLMEKDGKITPETFAWAKENVQLPKHLEYRGQ